jgi:hypothetical protein
MRKLAIPHMEKWKSWKTARCLDRLGITTYDEIEVLEDKWSDGGTRFRMRNGPIGANRVVGEDEESRGTGK